MKRLLNFINKRQLKYWHAQMESLELAIEYSNESEIEINKMLIEYKRYEKIVHGLKLQLGYDRNNRTQCFCNKCKNELISSGSYLKEDNNYVYYKCKDCNSESKWIFDTPVPILVEGSN